MEITVGQVSGIIAACVFVVQFLYPNALVLILACLIGNQHSAVTWSVVGRQVQNSKWPTFLRSDCTTSKGVLPTVSRLSLLGTLGTILISIAAIVTPLGLYDAVVPESEMRNVPFTYLQDNGPMGYGSMPVTKERYFDRVCGGTGGYSSCPGSGNVFKNVTDEDGFTIDTELEGDTYSITIPQSIIDLYDGGRAKFGRSVSSFWDIHSRQWSYITSKGANDDKVFPVDGFRMLDSHVLDQKAYAVQGLVVDMIKGGIGFRNHTIPTGLSQGAEWSEDLLFLTPESACVDTNLTLEFSLPDGSPIYSGGIEDVSLIDNGGFINLIQDYPKVSMDDNQNNPKLRERAYKAAWLVNVYSALVLNVTRPAPDAFGYLNSELGKRFPLAPGSAQASPGQIFMDTSFTTLVSNENVKTTTNSTITNTTITSGLYENPFDITSSNYSVIDTLCQGSGGADFANSSNIHVKCGLFYAAAKRKDGKNTLMTEGNSTWIQSVYTCASLTKASLKTVSFKFNATLGSDLTALSIVNITEKQYASDADKPLWGIEQPQEDFPISDISQLWGLVSDDFDASTAVANNISLKRAEELYIPGYLFSSSGLVPLSPGYEYIPASGMVRKILGSTYETIAGDTLLPIDYSGQLNLAMFQRWQNLTGSPDTVPDILHLIWTDLATNTLQGSRGWTEDVKTLAKRDSSSTSSSDSNLVPVLIYRKRVLYKWVYGIPAFITLGLFGLVALVSLVMSITRQGPARVRYYLNQLSAGRLLAQQQYQGYCDKGAPTGIWVERVGRQIVDITSSNPAIDQHGAMTTGYQDMKPGLYTSANEIGSPGSHNGGGSFPMTPMSGRPSQGYVKIEGQR